jgi:hypothetical protein
MELYFACAVLGLLAFATHTVLRKRKEQRDERRRQALERIRAALCS